MAENLPAASTKVSDTVAGGTVAASPRIADHELVRHIRSGAFGEVWLARNIIGTYRAVKIIHQQAFQHQQTFEKEFSGIQKFEPISREHEGFVDILQVGRNDGAGFYYYVMELADDASSGGPIQPAAYAAKTLSGVLAARHRLPYEECLQIALSLTAALDFLHRSGLVHRDIKPPNIIFVNGAPKLADIGLVTDVGHETYAGTPGYIPPEGHGKPQADLYSLGKVLYQITTGKAHGDFPCLPTDLTDPCDWEKLLKLNEIILKACEPDVRRRYQTAAEMRADLARLMGMRPL